MSTIEKKTSSPGDFICRSYQIIKEWITSILCKPIQRKKIKDSFLIYSIILA